MGKIKVTEWPAVVEPPQVLSLKRAVGVHPIRTQMKVTGTNLSVSIKLACSSRGFPFSAQTVKIHGAKIARYVPGEIKTRAFPKMKTKVKMREATKRIAVFPQERANRLQWQKVLPKRDGEIILAWFGSIVEDAVVKLTLNKQQGNLLIWYNPQSRRFDAKGLYLYRRFAVHDRGVHDNLEWRWM